jgi:hypothetical protein
VERGKPEELAEFAALSAKVSRRQATDEEKTRWRALRLKLRKGPPPPPPPARVAPAPQREHARTTRKLRLAYAEVKAMQVGFADEVSPGGLRLRVHHFIEAGSRLSLRLDLEGQNDPEPLLTNARVVWCRHEGGHYVIGLELINIRAEDRERIEAWMNKEPLPQP